jgi:hypothetical protein
MTVAVCNASETVCDERVAGIGAQGSSTIVMVTLKLQAAHRVNKGCAIYGSIDRKPQA